MQSLQSICCDGWILQSRGEDHVALDLSDRAEVDHHHVDHLKDEGNDCVSDQQAIVEV